MFNFFNTQKPIVFVKAYGIAFVFFLFLDTLWLSFIARDFFAEQFGTLLSGMVAFFPAFLFYAVYPMAIVWLCVIPAGEENIAPIGALTRGALLGLAAYGAYGFTNAATISGWPIAVTYVDTLWGMLITGAVAGLTVRVYRILE